MKKYYVYVYFDPRKPGSFSYQGYDFDYEPFYVGKGKEGSERHLKHLKIVKNNHIDQTINPFKFRLIKKILDTGQDPIILKIKENMDESEAYDLESKLIKEIGFRYTGQGSLVNIAEGGLGGDTFTNSPRKEETRILLRDRMLGEKNHKFGIKLEDTPSHKCKGENHWNTGRKFTMEQKEKMSKKRQGHKNANAKPILQFDLNYNFIKEWECIKYAREFYGLKGSAPIINCCVGNQFSSAGYIWRYKIDDTNDIQFIRDKKEHPKIGSKCVQICLGTRKVINTFTSIKKAEEVLGVQGVGLCCRGEAITCGGYDWEYFDNDLKVKYENIKKEFKENAIAKENSKKNKVMQFSLEDIFLKEWDSVSDVARTLKLNKASICQCCQGIRYKKVGGFKWSYKNK